jgi:hypothetical protein
MKKRSLRPSCPNVSTAAIEGLAAFGEVAQPAVPALKKYDPETLSLGSYRGRE